MEFSLPLEVKRSDITRTGRFTCMASTPDLDSHNDVVISGAFNKALAKHTRSSSRPAFLFNHNPDKILGIWLSFEETNAGLKATGQFSLDTDLGENTFKLLKAGAIKFSIGFRIAKNGFYKKNGVKYITDIDVLQEISATPIPSNQHCRFLAHKKTSIQQLRSFEHMLRKSTSLSISESKRCMSGDWGIEGIEEEQYIILLEVLTQNIEVSA